MAQQIIWSPRAQTHIDEILHGVEANDSATAAIKLGGDLLRAVEALEHTPLLGAVYEEARTAKVREIICHRYRIF